MTDDLSRMRRKMLSRMRSRKLCYKNLLKQLIGIILAAIINEDQLPIIIFTKLVQHRKQVVGKMPEPFFLIIAGDDDRYLHPQQSPLRIYKYLGIEIHLPS